MTDTNIYSKNQIILLQNCGKKPTNWCASLCNNDQRFTVHLNSYNKDIIQIVQKKQTSKSGRAQTNHQ